MTKFILLFTFSILSFSGFIFGQTPNWNWVKKSGGTAQDYGRAVTSDASGNVYVTGSFYSASMSFSTTSLTNKDNTGTSPDVFVVKYDPSGNVLWAKSAGGTSYDEGESINVDANGNVFVTGYFLSSTINFSGTILNNTGDDDLFVAKYDLNGILQWVKSASGSSTEKNASINIDAFGDIIVTGRFDSPTINFSGTTLTNTSSSLNSDFYIVKYNQAGNIVWAKNNGGAYDDVSASITTDISGNIYITGNFESPSIALGSTTLTVSGTSDIFIVKYDVNGNVGWAKREGGTSDDFGCGISTDANNNIIVTGYFFSPTINFGTGNLTKQGTYNTFLVKYSSSGVALWATNQKSKYTNKSYGVSTDANDNIYITGDYYSGNVYFGTDSLTNVGQNDIYVAKYDGSGNFIWAKGAGGLTADYGYAINAQSNGNVYVTGMFTSVTINFDTFTFNTTGNADVFVGKIGNSIIGIQEINSTHNIINVYPNPSNSHFRVNNLLNTTQIQIFNINGELIYNSICKQDYLNIDLSNQAKGIYFLKITDENFKIKQAKLVLQ